MWNSFNKNFHPLPSNFPVKISLSFVNPLRISDGSVLYEPSSGFSSQPYEKTFLRLSHLQDLKRPESQRRRLRW